ncbi:F-box/FBD/LRR-repeat protein At1g13570 [Sorghum bicolor]|uniref:F-box domain-containing protein n=1 Tax=Sorghum bicolor TaxID=4558 RepID=A0A1B6QCS7_SORBI|nr:F-box/FBD/LRR-repeat protein At1g13570 [Sorghum bicolor]KXG35725.1 hypothetical protein SORBI_3002G217900 [Sorghum bicolor]|eukprot:XP_002462460.2 F-box/FBD/LRR-repeat protein At1g13570 [Sorghum bicolor]
MAPRRPLKKRQIPNSSAMPVGAVDTDALLSLPQEILDEVLARLDLRDAVRTSALCRAWRRRWETLPSIDISIPSGKEALSTIDCVLLRCSGRVQRFYVSLDKLSARRLDDWLLVLSRRGCVEDIFLSPEPHEFFSLHSAVFSWRCLISVDLSACHIPPLPPDFEGFPVLKVLSLVDVKFQQNGEYQLEEIIETSPLLEQLILSEVHIGGDEFIEWEIRAPNLRHITICSTIDYGWAYSQEVNGTKILENLPCNFDNLKSLKLFMDFCELPPILSVFCLLKSMPNLEKLKMKIYNGEVQKVELNGEFLNAQWEDGMCANLQILEMTGINWLPNEISFMKLILSKARLLRTLWISHHGDCSVSHVDPLHELVTCGKASAQAQVLFKGAVENH